MNVSIDHVWSLKEEPSSRANNWRSQEIRTLLRMIRENDMMRGGPSLNLLGQRIEPLLGSTRSAFQITGKLKNLRKAYLRCLRKGRTPAALLECPYYDDLAEIYKTPQDLNDSDESEDTKLCSERGIALMFNVIDELNLAADLTLQSFSSRAIRLISKMLVARGICAPVDKVKSTLVSLRKSYIESRRGDHGNIKNFRYHEHLHALWGSAPVSNLKIHSRADSHQSQIKLKPLRTKMEPVIERRRGDYWSNEETVVLLTSIKALDLTKEAFANDETAAMKLSDALRDGGYSKSCDEIRRRLDSMRTNFQQAKRAKSEVDAVRRFPFYHLYEGTFGPSSVDETAPFSDVTRSEKFRENMNIGVKIRSTRSRGWTDEETIYMLDLLDELNLTQLAAHRLSYEVACEIVEPLSQRGYVRSAIQIQIKLRNLRSVYHRCVKDGRTEKAIAECPFYHKLDSIFGQRPDDIERKVSQKMMRKTELGKFIDSTESYNDHCYFNGTSVANDKRRVLPKFKRTRSEEDYENGSQVWLPIETICDEDDGNADEREEPAFHDDHNSSEDFEVIDETHMYSPEANETNSLENLEDPLDESTHAEIYDDLESNDNEDNNVEENNGNNKNLKRSVSSEQTRRRSSRLESAAAAKTFDAAARRTNRRNDTSTDEDSTIVRSIKIIMSEVLRHEKLLQRQHHAWMERQFEMQRKYDRDQRELLLKELREFRKWLPKRQNNGQRS